MNIHLPAILMFTRGIGFWPIPRYVPFPKNRLPLPFPWPRLLQQLEATKEKLKAVFNGISQWAMGILGKYIYVILCIYNIIILYYTMIYYIILYSIILYYLILSYIILYYLIWYYIIYFLYIILYIFYILYSILFYYIILSYLILYYIILYYIFSIYIILFLIA